MIRSSSLVTGFVLEFKARWPGDKATLEEAAQDAVQQIRDRDYAAELRAVGLDEKRIHLYGFAFSGKQVVACGAGKA